MGTFPAIPLRRRPVRSRVLAVYRLPAGRLAALLPDGLVPRLRAGHGVAVACYTHLGAPRLFGSRARGSEHLTYRIAVADDDGSPACWVARRETTSWLEARCGARLLRGSYARSSFRFQEDPSGVELAVEGEDGPGFYLRAAPAPGRLPALFDGVESLAGFLHAGDRIVPHAPFAPEAETLELADGQAVERLLVHESRPGLLAEAGAELDGAWRIVRRVVAPARAVRRERRALPSPGSVTALPAP